MSLYKARLFVERNRAAITRAMLALVTAMVLLGWESDWVRNALVSSGLLLVLILGFVMEMSVALSRLISVRPRVDIARDENENIDLLKTYLSKRPVEKADMLEYSAVAARPLIDELVRKGATLRILIKHPATVGPEQEKKILASIGSLERFVLQHHGARVEIRCYKAPASLRGRKIDDLLLDVGWYTPDLSPQGVVDKLEIIGHLNPVVMCSAATEEGLHLREMFDRVFEPLWESAKNDDVRSVTGHHETSS